MKNKLLLIPKKTSTKFVKRYTKSMKKRTLLKYDTPVSVLEEQQGVSLGVPANTKLGKYLENIGFPSLAEMMKS